jgi:hypothetical protein
MFQPQATPFSFNAYGVGLSAPGSEYPAAFQPSSSVTDNGGPTLFRDPIFTTHYDQNPNNHHHHNNHARQRYTMAGHGMNDMDAQEALAREFQPPLEVIPPG